MLLADVTDEYLIYLLNNQYLNNPAWDIKEYEVKADDTTSFYSKIAHRTVTAHKLTTDNMDEFNQLVNTINENRKIK